jgi:hypothetical protein
MVIIVPLKHAANKWSPVIGGMFQVSGGDMKLVTKEKARSLIQAFSKMVSSNNSLGCW